MSAPAVDQHVVDGLRGIRGGLHLRWNPKGKLIAVGSFDAAGKARKPKYEPRWEVWDKSPDGLEYMVMRVQTPQGEFRAPGDWLVHHLNLINPERYGGDVNRMLQELMEKPEALREMGTEKDQDDAFEAAGKWAEWCETPKSGSLLVHRGKRLLSA